MSVFKRLIVVTATLVLLLIVALPMLTSVHSQERQPSLRTPATLFDPVHVEKNGHHCKKVESSCSCVEDKTEDCDLFFDAGKFYCNDDKGHICKEQ